MQLFLGVNESSGYGITQECLAVLLKVRYFFAAQRERPFLFLAQLLTLIDQALVLGASLLVTQESVDALVDGFYFRLVQDGLAKFPGLR
jgi:hypothetical protein